MAEDNQEKTEEPSQYKLEESRRKGSVFKSMDINSVLVMFAALMLMMSVGTALIHRVFELCARIFAMAGQLNFDLRHLTVLFGGITLEAFFILSALMASTLLVGVLSTILQTGLVFTFFPLKPDLKRLNPIEGFKRLFSLKLLFESFKSILKLAIITSIVFFSITAVLGQLLMLLSISPAFYLYIFLEHATSIIFKLLIALVFVALFDLLFVRSEYIKKMKMSKHEVKEEHKRRDGDPNIKAKRKEIQSELRKRSSAVGQVPNADVVVTNPTHLAVLLKYDPKKMSVPIVLAKASGKLVQGVKDAAHRYRVPVIEQKSLARLLFKQTKTDGPIPSESYIEVARVLRQAYQKRGYV